MYRLACFLATSNIAILRTEYLDTDPTRSRAADDWEIVAGESKIGGRTIRARQIAEPVPMPEKKLVIKLKFGTSIDPDRRSPPTRNQPQYDWNYKRIATALGIGVIAFVLLAYVVSSGAPDRETIEPVDERQAPVVSKPLAEEPPAGFPTVVERESSAPADENSRVITPPIAAESQTGTFHGDKIVPNNLPVTKKMRPKGHETHKESVVPAQNNRIRPAGTPNVLRAQFAWGIKDKEPTGEIRSPAIIQPGDSVVLYFFTQFNGLNGQSVSHVWRRNGQIVAVRDFDIGADSWRVFSSKQLNSKLLGEWTVTIKNAEGKSLGEFALEVLEPAR